MTIIKDMWDNSLIKGVVILAALGFAPVIILTKVMSTLGA